MKCRSVGIPAPMTEFCNQQLTLFQTNDNSRHLRAIPWPSGRWRARRCIDTGKPAGSMTASTHGGTRSHVAMAGGVWAGERGAAAAAAAAVARRRGATPTGGAVTPPRSAPARGRNGARVGGWDRPPRDGALLPVPRDGVRNRRRAAATKAGAQARSPAVHRGRVEPRKSLHVVAARNLGRLGGAGGQAPSGPCDPCGRTVLLRRVTLFAFSVIATLPTSTRPQIPEDMNADCHLCNGEQVP